MDDGFGAMECVCSYLPLYMAVSTVDEPCPTEERPYSHYTLCPSAKAYSSSVNNRCHRSNGTLGFRNHACQLSSFLTGEVGILGSSITKSCPLVLVVMPSVGSYIVQIISSSEFSSKLDEFLNQVEGVWILAVCR